jgi:hypothetical protein
LIRGIQHIFITLVHVKPVGVRSIDNKLLQDFGVVGGFLTPKELTVLKVIAVVSVSDQAYIDTVYFR